MCRSAESGSWGSDDPQAHCLSYCIIGSDSLPQAPPPDKRAGLSLRLPSCELRQQMMLTLTSCKMRRDHCMHLRMHRLPAALACPSATLRPRSRILENARPVARAGMHQHPGIEATRGSISIRTTTALPRRRMPSARLQLASSRERLTSKLAARPAPHRSQRARALERLRQTAWDGSETAMKSPLRQFGPWREGGFKTGSVPQRIR